MAKKKSSDDLFDVLRAHGLRKRVAKTIAQAQDGGKGGGRRAESLAREALGELRAAGDVIRSRLIDRGDGAKRSAAGKKAAATRKRNAAGRSASAKKAAQTRAKGRGRAKSGSR